MSFPMCDPKDPNADVDCKKTGTGGHPALKDHDVRRAIAHAIDKQALVDRVLQGYGSIGTTVIPPYNRWRAEPAELIQYDPAEANASSTRRATSTPTATGSARCPGAASRSTSASSFAPRARRAQRQASSSAGWLDEIGMRRGSMSSRTTS